MNLHVNDLALLAQSGAVTPASFSGLIRWWDAGSLAYANGTAIDNGSNKLTDRSSTADHANQSSASLQPVVTTGVQNGLRGVTFDGTDDELNFTSTGALTALTIFAVLKGSSNIQATYGILKDSGGSADFRLDIGASVNVRYRLNDSGNDNLLSNDFTAAYNAAHCAVVACDSGGSNNATFYEGDVPRGTGTIATFSAQFNRIAAAVGANFTGNLLELLVYNQKLNSTQIGSLYNGYLKPRWGL